MPDPSPPKDLPAFAYVACFIGYVALGYALKSAVLNWVVGPLFLLVVLHVIPRAFARRPSAGDGVGGDGDGGDG